MASSALGLCLAGLAACSSSGPPARDASPTKVRSAAPETAAPAPAKACEKVGDVVRLSKSTGRSLGPGIAWDGSADVVAWVEDGGDQQHVVAARVGADGHAGDPARVGGVAALPPVAIAASSGGGLILWGDDRDRTAEIYARAIGADGATGGERRLSDAGRRDPDREKRLGLDLVTGGAREPAAFAQGDERVGAWSMPQPPRSQIYVLPWPEGAPTRVSTGPADTYGPAIARSRGRLGVAWCTGVPGRFEVMVATSAAPAETPPAHRIAETEWGPCAPAIAPAGDGFVVAWVGGGEREGKVIVASVAADGTAGTPREVAPIALRAPGTQIDRLVSATATEGGVLLAWASPRPDGTGAVSVSLVGPDGAELAPPAVLTSSGTRHPSDIGIAPSADDVALAWHDEPAEGEAEDVYFLRARCR